MVKKPPVSGFPWYPQTLGEKIRKRRLELGLTQEEAAKQMGLNNQITSRWETGRNAPKVKHYPSIIAFLGYYPFKIDNTLGGKSKQYRFIHGLSQRKFACKCKIPLNIIQGVEKAELTSSMNFGSLLLKFLSR